MDALTGALKDGDAGVRQQALRPLPRLRDPRTIPALITSLKGVSMNSNCVCDLSAFWMFFSAVPSWARLTALHFSLRRVESCCQTSGSG